jgi:hypothetical protein
MRSSQSKALTSSEVRSQVAEEEKKKEENLKKKEENLRKKEDKRKEKERKKESSSSLPPETFENNPQLHQQPSTSSEALNPEKKCYICSKSFSTFSKYLQNKWVGCEDCSNWICCKCKPKKLKSDDEFICSVH